MVGGVGELWGAYVDDVDVEKPVGEPAAHEDVVAVGRPPRAHAAHSRHVPAALAESARAPVKPRPRRARALQQIDEAEVLEPAPERLPDLPRAQVGRAGGELVPGVEVAADEQPLGGRRAQQRLEVLDDRLSGRVASPRLICAYTLTATRSSPAGMSIRAALSAPLGAELPIAPDPSGSTENAGASMPVADSRLRPSSRARGTSAVGQCAALTSWSNATSGATRRRREPRAAAWLFALNVATRRRTAVEDYAHAVVRPGLCRRLCSEAAATKRPLSPAVARSPLP
jgi:hypothetical protein